MALLLVAFVAYRAGRSGMDTAVSVPEAAPPNQASIAAAPAPPPVSVAPAVAPAAQPAPAPALLPLASAAAAPSIPPTAATQPAEATTPQSPAAYPMRSLADLIEVIEPSVVRIDVVKTRGKSTGSGFVVDRDGTVVTNYHVIAGAVRATAKFADGSQAPVLGYQNLLAKKDIAVLKIDCPSEKLHPIGLATALPRKGESVVGFGAPRRLSFSASEGIVSSIRSAQEMAAVDAHVQGTWIQTTTPISPGSSGGPLVNLQGEVVGANTLTRTDGQNLNFAISATDIREAVAAKSDKLTAIDPEAAPSISKTAESDVAEEIGTPRGRRLLGGLQQVELVVLAFRQDPTGRVEQLVLGRARDALKKTGLIESSSRESADAVMIVVMALKVSGRGTAGTSELVVSAVLLCEDPDSESDDAVCVWKAEDTVGTFALASLFRGVIPRNTDAKVAAFFRKFITDFRTAQREQQEAESSADDEKTNAAE